MNQVLKTTLKAVGGFTAGMGALIGLFAFQEYMCKDTYFKGTINKEKIQLYNYERDYYNGFAQSDVNLHLLVEREDGTKILYHDDRREQFEDIKKRQIERVEITKDGETIEYIHNEKIGKPTVEIAQKQFIQYLDDIHEYRLNKGLEGITK